MSRVSRLASIAAILLVSGCSRAPFVEPSRPGEEPRGEPAAETEEEQSLSSGPKSRSPIGPGPRQEREGELDFALAFVDSAKVPSLADDDAGLGDAGPNKAPAATEPLRVPRAVARVLLKRSTTKAVFYSLGDVDIRAGGAKKAGSCRGRIAVEASNLVPGEAILRASGTGRLRVELPCTLLARSAHNYFEYGETSYRGSLVLIRAGRGGCGIVNLVAVEDYLRGVVPLEIGPRAEEEIEAVKAQAVAARTYTYRRIIERESEPYDLTSDVSDQVYGGVTAERPDCDLAVRDTRDLVLAYEGEIILAYYHSTCGGQTANVEDVWNKPPQPYLKSVPDVDAQGKPYCGISRYYAWEESWTPWQLAEILARFGPQAFPSSTAPRGRVTGMTVRHRFVCGRVGSCVVTTENGSHEYGGDKVRFAVRRGVSGYPILRSSRFSVTGIDSKAVRIRGSGYGHGVGMCQMGAIGRARAGQEFEEILGAYYGGASIRRIDVSWQSAEGM
ncbi:MAG: SpoIID/LytB domain-containing protein [Chitinivibrionales bacterium]|nr:SpoIID/LytB domain-containing protein [Chitinivibrionales bacterium]MBD3395112.1 SpoIID/LytB domain-containing protein [Chitinivibrionales bacterium]